MANITIVIPDADLPKVVEALCDGVSPTNAKAKTKVIELVKDYTRAYYVKKAQTDNQSLVQTANQNVFAAVTVAGSGIDAINIT